MAYSHGRKFRRIAAAALTADPGEMRALIERILPPREENAPPVLRIASESDWRAAPATIVAAFFADMLTGGEAIDLLRQAESPATLTEARAGWEDPLADAIRAWGEVAGDKRSGTSSCCDAASEGVGLVCISENTSSPGPGAAADTNLHVA